MSTRPVLVTGGAGFIGGAVVRRLLEQGRTVHVLDDLSVGTRARVPSDAQLLVGDVRDARTCAEATSGIDTVMHLAARVTIRASLDTFVDDADINLLGTLRLAEAAIRNGVRRFVFASSMAVYSDATQGRLVTEQHPTAPLSPYGHSKLAAERIASQVLERAGVACSVLRFFNTFGPGQTYTPYVGVATIFTTRLLRGEPITIFGDGEQERDFVHVDDVADAVTGCLGAPGGTYNVGTGIATRVNEVARLLIERLRPGLEPTYAEAQAGELRYSVADITAAQAAFGYQPRRRLADHLDDVISSVSAVMAAADTHPTDRPA